MSLYDKLREDMQSAMKRRDDAVLAVLKLVIGDLDLVLYSKPQKGQPLTDEQVIKEIDSHVKKCEEQLELGDSERVRQQRDFLQGYLPTYLTVDEIVEALRLPHTGHATVIGLDSEGKAMGWAMKCLKLHGLPVQGADVKLAVQKIRKGSEQTC